MKAGPSQPTLASTTERSAEPSSFLTVGIGASAGGLEAMEEFFRHMPPSSGMAFVVVSHQHVGHVSFLPSLLGKCTAMPVVEARAGMRVEPNHVYLGPGGVNVAMMHGVMHLMESHSETRVPLPIDYFFRSLAADQKQCAAGVILSGTGTDGTLGLRAIKAESGMTMVQEPQSAKYQGMPRSAIAAGFVDVVKPAGEMSGPLRSYARSFTNPMLPISERDDPQTLQKIFILLRERTGNDFTFYKGNTIHRRIERRMNVHQIESLKSYLRFVLANPHELDALFQELLIGVTSFFRDPASFDVLVRKGLPSLMEGKPDGASLRVWVPGCSTGEEAYSLAIQIREFLAKRKLRLTVQIFASDLDSRSIDQARAGLYPIGIASDLSPERLRRFFVKEDGSYRVKKDIRDLVIFATHNVLTDAPFTKLDLLSCRNLLIYLDTKAQRKLLPLFHYSLKPNGILLLGSSETIGGFESLFTVIDRKWKLFRRTSVPGLFPRMESFPNGPMKETSKLHVELEVPVRGTRAASISDLIQQLLVERYAPAAVIVNERQEVVYIHGHTGAYLEPAPGLARHHLIEMAREGLQHDLAMALHLAAGKDDEVVRQGIRVRANGDVILVDVIVKKIADPEALQGLFLVTFSRVQEDTTAARKGVSARATAPLKKGESGLRGELEFTKQRLQRTVEELQTSNEELKSTNEELQSTNEELQSTNEELETAKEELQSLNEELVTVNSELQGKLDALGDVNDDLQNLMNSTEVATIFLDNDLRVKRFTSEVKRVSNLIALDIGRPLSDIASKLSYDCLLEDASEVLRTLVVKEAQVQSTDGGWFTMRILPYRSSKNAIDGLVMTFVDISEMKQVEGEASAAHDFSISIVETVSEPLLVLDARLLVILANQSFYQTFQVTQAEVEQQFLYNLCHGACNLPKLRALIEEILPKSNTFKNFMVDQTFPVIGHKVFSLNARRLDQKEGVPARILLAMREVEGGGKVDTVD